LAKADEADELAGIVSLSTDKARLRAMAEEWRQLAARMAGPDRAPSPPKNEGRREPARPPWNGGHGPGHAR
jgi:hypothetical protein